MCIRVWGSMCGCLCGQTQNYLCNTLRQPFSSLPAIVITIQTSKANYLPVKKNNQVCIQIKTIHRRHGLKTKTIIKSAEYGYYVFHLIKTCIKILNDQLFYHFVFQRLLYKSLNYSLYSVNQFFSVECVENSDAYSHWAPMWFIHYR